MQYIVIGCGRVGAELAYRLFIRGNSAVVIDISESAFHNLPVDFRGRTVVGDAMSRDVLVRAGIEDAGGMAVVTSNDAINAVVARIAQEVYHVPIIAVRNFDSHLRPVLEVFGLQLVSSSSWGAQRIEEILYQQETRAVFSAGNGEVELYEFAVPPGWNGHLLEEFMPGKECAVAALTRGGRAVLPGPNFILEEGDLLLVSATLEGSQALHRKLNNGYSAPMQKEA